VGDTTVSRERWVGGWGPRFGPKKKKSVQENEGPDFFLEMGGKAKTKHGEGHGKRDFAGPRDLFCARNKGRFSRSGIRQTTGPPEKKINCTRFYPHTSRTRGAFPANFPGGPRDQRLGRPVKIGDKNRKNDVE